MRRSLYSSSTIVFVICMLGLSTSFAQTEDSQLQTALSQDKIVPNYHYEYVPDFTYEEVDRRIKAMDIEMKFELNDKVFSFIQYFTVRNRDYTKMVLARKEMYFPMFDETMEKHEMPLEIKYLSIIESGLDPQIRSRVGAMGLWQFMPATGRMYGMHTNEEIDDRMDPEMSTEAAAKYLKSLYRMFGDWEVAMAAYNCGPGNVRKAIRRSGGQKTFWGIYNHLPRETRSYVPQVQAMLYILEHLEEHNFHPENPSYFLEYEKVNFDSALSLEKLAELTNICVSDLKTLNPAIKNTTIPASNQNMALRVPKNVAPFIHENLAWISDSLSNQPRTLLASDMTTTPVETLAKEVQENRITYKVKSGDVLGSIARRHGVTVSQIKAWNNLSSNTIRVGQRLSLAAGTTTKTVTTTTVNTAGQTTYTVQPGDSLWVISKKHAGITVEQLKRLNNLNDAKIKPGQTLIIG